MSNASELDQKGFREEAAGLSWPGVFLEFLGIILRRQASENPEMETTAVDSVGGNPAPLPRQSFTLWLRSRMWGWRFPCPRSLPGQLQRPGLCWGF